MKKSKVFVVAVILLFISLIFVFVGISVSIFNYFGEGMTNNVIQTGRVVFSYSDANGGTNGIYIQDAEPMQDDLGKMLSGEREYFDFTVSATTTSTDLNYEIVVKKDNTSTLDEKYAKIYLTAFNGNTEVATPLTTTSDGVVTYSNLTDTTNSSLSGKTVYYGEVKKGEVAYSKKFRLRMWVSAKEGMDYNEVNNKSFSVKVNVSATGVR